tara:strand:- start:1093 stop:1824 length:732 start_codon:yes stop_codon:yes gene_type:complete
MDSYEKFFIKTNITKEDFFKFGIEETIFANVSDAKSKWKELSERIRDKCQNTFYIRGYGRDSYNTDLYTEFYKEVFEISVEKDGSGNGHPRKLIENMTGFSKNPTKKSQHRKIKNYQVSHIFGKTKNIYMFTAPWNIAYVPKIIDPFTGHEAYGYMVEEYTDKFRQETYSRFRDLIDDYNKIISEKIQSKKFNEYLSDKSNYSDDNVKRFIKSVEDELSEIGPFNQQPSNQVRHHVPYRTSLI